MPTANLTEKKIARLKAPDPSGRQVIHWDTELRGFGVLCSGVTDAKTFIVQRVVRGSKHPHRVTVAKVALLDLKEARDRARRLLMEMQDGKDPKPHLGAASVTLRQVLDEYLKNRSSLAERSRQSYRDLVERHLPDWLDRDLRSITPDMVEERHRAIKEGVETRGRHSGNATANGVMVALRTLWNYRADRDEGMPASPTRRLKRNWFSVPRPGALRPGRAATGVLRGGTRARESGASGLPAAPALHRDAQARGGSAHLGRRGHGGAGDPGPGGAHQGQAQAGPADVRLRLRRLHGVPAARAGEVRVPGDRRRGVHPGA
jgi:Arm DNA-binding domain